MRVLVPVLLLLLAACGPRERVTAAQTPPFHAEKLAKEIGELAEQAKPGVLDVGLMNLESGEVWLLDGSRPMPMQSVFKAPLGAAVLAEVDAGRLSLDEVITVTDQDLSPPFSPLADAFPGVSAYTVRELLVLTVGESDNTAADLLMKRIGGPGGVTAWLDSEGVRAVRIDRYERELQVEAVGMAAFRPAWKGEAAFTQALATVPPAQRRAAMIAYLTDPRDTATVSGALNFLYRLAGGDLLKPASTALLLKMMTDTPTGAARLKAGLPEGTALAHKTGSGRTDLGVNPASNDIGLITLKDGRRYAVAVFLAGSTASAEERDALIAKASRAMVEAVD